MNLIEFHRIFYFYQKRNHMIYYNINSMEQQNPPLFFLKNATHSMEKKTHLSFIRLHFTTTLCHSLLFSNALTEKEDLKSLS